MSFSFLICFYYSFYSYWLLIYFFGNHQCQSFPIFEFFLARWTVFSETSFTSLRDLFNLYMHIAPNRHPEELRWLFLDAGVYDEEGENIYIRESITIIGASRSETIIKGCVYIAQAEM